MQRIDRLKSIFVKDKPVNLSTLDLSRFEGKVQHDGSTNDGLVNVASSIGTSKDKNSYNDYAMYGEIPWSTLISAYRSSWVCGKIVDIPAEEMTREWRYFTMEDSDMREKMENAELKFNLKDIFREAITWSRLFGGSAIFIGTDDGDMTTPLDLDRIRRGDLKFLRVIDNRIIYPITSGNVFSPSSKNFMDPEFYIIANNYGDNFKYTGESLTAQQYAGSYGSQPIVHKSRIVRFDGIKLPLFEFFQNKGWGDSILTRVFSAVSKLDSVHAAIASLVHEANVDIMKIEGLSQQLKSSNGENRLKQRLLNNNFVKSFLNMMVLDKTEELERKAVSFASLDLILEKNLSICAAAADIPATRLLGSSPDGMNATGASDLRNFYDSVRSSQVQIMTEKLKYLDKIIALSELGFIPEDLKFQFKPLWQMTEKEVADIQNIQADRDVKYLSNGVVTPAIVAEQLRVNETYVGITDDVVKDLESMESFTEEELLENVTENGDPKDEDPEDKKAA